ncbi:MAG TPA: cupin domain-containing protein [Blastocatellia bacterium]|nr:cupin domain-containing protein [Blastocatellia bacterium]
MKHGTQLDEAREMAALYSLGALTQREASAFEEHIDEGCDFCRTELEAFERTASALAFGAPEMEPSPGVREKLIAATGGDAQSRKAESHSARIDARAFVSIRAEGSKWTKVEEGIFIKPLYYDRASGLATTLVKMMPGTALPAHQHNGVEQLFILEGDCNVRGEVLGPGDYHRASTGTVHETTFTVHGTVFLLVAPAEYTVLGPQ